MKHDKEHVIEMSWLYATDWIKAVHMFHYRLTESLAEDKFFESAGTRQEIDFNCYLMALRRLERAVSMGYKAWGDLSQDIPKALSHFNSLTPYLADVRNANEHFDDYLNYKGNSKKVDVSAMGVWAIKANGKSIYRQGGVILESIEAAVNSEKVWEIEWLDHKVNITHATKAADELYLAYLKWFKAIPKPIND
ncbi:MAG TPA: hypothetical protein VMR18_02750 [Candidatus Saccharimonadales bacterium]|jgi:hypothetical protein|nr:hypothetical protein [Candidatus Saccharimonadales bacterium]